MKIKKTPTVMTERGCLGRRNFTEGIVCDTMPAMKGYHHLLQKPLLLLIQCVLR